jgi:hypothetical protein
MGDSCAGFRENFCKHSPMPLASARWHQSWRLLTSWSRVAIETVPITATSSARMRNTSCANARHLRQHLRASLMRFRAGAAGFCSCVAMQTRALKVNNARACLGRETARSHVPSTSA